MTYGDAYIYCAIINQHDANRINAIKTEIQSIRDEIKHIRETNPKPDLELFNRTSMLGAKAGEKYSEIIDVCRNPVAFTFVASDEPGDGYECCAEYVYRAIPVKEFLDGVKNNADIDPEIFGKHSDGYCICLPSHYDEDEEFLQRLNIRCVRHDTRGVIYHTPALQPGEPEYNPLFDPEV